VPQLATSGQMHSSHGLHSSTLMAKFSQGPSISENNVILAYWNIFNVSMECKASRRSNTLIGLVHRNSDLGITLSN
jgi:hypothetical protein